MITKYIENIINPIIMETLQNANGSTYDGADVTFITLIYISIINTNIYNMLVYKYK